MKSPFSCESTPLPYILSQPTEAKGAQAPLYVNISCMVVPQLWQKRQPAISRHVLCQPGALGSTADTLALVKWSLANQGGIWWPNLVTNDWDQNALSILISPSHQWGVACNLHITIIWFSDASEPKGKVPVQRDIAEYDKCSEEPVGICILLLPLAPCCRRYGYNL